MSLRENVPKRVADFFLLCVIRYNDNIQLNPETQICYYKTNKQKNAKYIYAAKPLTSSYYQDFLLQVGDRIVSICGTSTEGMTHSQAVSILKNASGTIELQVKKNFQYYLDYFLNIILPVVMVNDFSISILILQTSFFSSY